jgi:hypothetical protein
MKHILTISIAIVAVGFLSGSSRLVPSSRSLSPRALPASPSTPPETRSYVYESPPDGTGGETVTRNGDAISGDMFIGAHHAHYEGRIAADGTIPRLDIRAWHSAAEAKHPRILSAILGRDSTLLIEHLGSHVDTLRFASQPGLLPIINPSMGLIELVVARARSQGARSAKVRILEIDGLNLEKPRAASKVGAGVGPVDITFLAGDTVMLGTPTSKDQMRLVVGADGRIRSAKNGSTAKDRFSMRPTSKAVQSAR